MAFLEALQRLHGPLKRPHADVSASSHEAELLAVVEDQRAQPGQADRPSVPVGVAAMQEIVDGHDGGDIAGFYPLRQGELPALTREALADIMRVVARTDENLLLSRIEERLTATNQKPEAASKKARLGRDFIRTIQRRPDTWPRADNLVKLAEALECDVRYLLGEIDIPLPIEAELIPILGFVGADTEGRVIFSTGQGTGDFVPSFRYMIGEANVLESRGGSLGELAPDGSLIYFGAQRTPPTPDMNRKLVVAELTTGEVLVKTLRRGTREGLYDLDSIIGPVWQDVALVWAAKVKTIIMPDEARRIMIKAGSRAA